MNCIFCEIAFGNAPASLVYEDDAVLGIMSLDQPNPYKVLVVPRDHVETIYDLSNELASRIFQAAVKISRAIREVSACDGLNLVQSNGTAAQQDVLHFHLHLIPRFRVDDISFKWEPVRSDRETLDRMAQELRSNISS